MDNPSPEQMRTMIAAIHNKADAFLKAHDLPPPEDFKAFRELLRLIFDEDEAGRAIFARFDQKLLETLWEMYPGRLSQ